MICYGAVGPASPVRRPEAVRSRLSCSERFMPRKPLNDIEDFHLLAELQRRAERAVAEARRLCEADRRVREDMRRRLAELRRNISLR